MFGQCGFDSVVPFPLLILEPRLLFTEPKQFTVHDFKKPPAHASAREFANFPKTRSIVLGLQNLAERRRKETLSAIDEEMKDVE
jgi:hypothetical protein